MGAKVEIYNIITELARKGVAVVMISSELPELLGMCDRHLYHVPGPGSRDVWKEMNFHRKRS